MKLEQPPSIPPVAERYVEGALKHLVIEPTDARTYQGYTTAVFGVYGFGATPEQCARDLHDELVLWVFESVDRHDLLPVIDGFDLNEEESVLLIKYCTRRS